MSGADPFAEFKAALEEYRKRRSALEEVERQGLRKTDTWDRHDLHRRAAAENLWVSAMAGLFDLLTTNYKAQERLLDKQLELAEKSAKAADRVAWWTKALVIVTGVLILATIFTGLIGFANH